eukprot:scaffold6166_cov65-Attheya_sp.AAC.1
MDRSELAMGVVGAIGGDMVGCCILAASKSHALMKQEAKKCQAGQEFFRSHTRESGPVRPLEESIWCIAGIGGVLMGEGRR